MAKKTTKKVKKKTNTSYVKASKPKTAPTYKNTAVAPTYKQRTYVDPYAGRRAAQLNKVLNRQEFSYDPLQDASYKALANVYNNRANIAAKDTMGDAAALNGGYGSSYATTAAAQARGQYNQELASVIPQLEQNAYQRYSDAYQRDLSSLEALQNVGAEHYGRFRDTVADDQWLYGQKYTKYRDDVTDNQWLYTQNYNKYRDDMSDYQWAQKYNRDVYEWEEQFEEDKKNNAAQRKALKSSSSGGGGGSSSGGYGGYSGYSGGDGYQDYSAADYDKYNAAGGSQGHNVTYKNASTNDIRKYGETRKARFAAGRSRAESARRRAAARRKKK